MKSCFPIAARILVAQTFRVLRARSGGVALEFAFLIPILIVLGIGAFDFGRLGLEKIAITGAARAGAQYGHKDFFTASNPTGIEQAARDDYGGTLCEDCVVPRVYYVCPGEGEVGPTDGCSDGGTSLMYVDVTVKKTVNLLFPYPGIEMAQDLETTSTVRVR